MTSEKSRIQLKGGITFKEPITHIKERQWGWQQLLPMMERDSRFRIAKPAREETLSPAERRKMAEDRLEEGLDWLDQGNAREAEKSFWKSIVADETFADGYNHLGILTFERGDWHRSAEFYRLALAEARKEFDPNDRRLGWWS